MALFPGTLKEEESRNCPGLESRDFGNSYLLVPTSDWSEASTKVVALFESLTMPCCTTLAHVEKKSILDF